jgi:hypothetical protein
MVYVRRAVGAVGRSAEAKVAVPVQVRARAGVGVGAETGWPELVAASASMR